MAASRSCKGVALPYGAFDELRSVHRSAIVENKRLDAALEMVAEMQVGRDLQRSKRGPRRTGQTDHMFGNPDGAESNGYVKRGRKPGRPPCYTRREQAPSVAPVPEVGRASANVDLRLTESDKNRIADVVTMLSEYQVPRSTPANEASP